MPMLTSIIIPYYNVEGTILQCLESVAAQTTKQLEVLLVDDCGQDGTTELVNDFISKYSGPFKFRVLRQEKNQGQSAARNRGILEATGDCIYFLDSDDYISRDCIELLSQELEKDESIQMAIGNYAIVGPQHFAPFKLQQRIYTSDEIIREQLSFNIYSMPWNKLIRRQFLIDNQLFFQPGIVHEDNLWSLCTAFCLDKMSVLLKPTYYYIIRQGSTERSHNRAWHQNQLFEVYKHLISFIFNSDAPSKKNVKSRLDVFRFVEENMIPLIMEPYITGDKDLAFSHYCDIRALCYWHWKDLATLHASWKDRYHFFHRTMSVETGFKTFVRQHAHYKIKEDMNTMRVSIITVNYNNLSGLRRTLPSVLAQTYTGYELIVVDGGSTDGSKEYIQSIERIDQWVSEPDSGVYNAMNKAVQMAHGTYCLFMNSGDTFFSPTVLETVVGKLRTADVYTGCSTFIEGNKTYTCYPPYLMNIDFLLVNSLNHQATFTKTAFLRENPFDETYKITADWGVFMKSWLLDKCTYEYLPDMVAIYYMDGISTTRKDLAEKERKKQFESVLKTLEEQQLKGDVVCAIKTFYAENDPTKKKIAQQYRDSNKDLRHKRKLIDKISKAMSMPPLQRDKKIALNAIKMFFKDLF